MQGRTLTKKHAAKLSRRNAFLALKYRVENLEPRFERDIGILENCADEDGEPIGVSAPTGFIRALPFPRLSDLVNRLRLAATRALNFAVWPTAILKESTASGFVGERRHKLLEGHHA
jgi:hypothetical protein